MKTCSKCGKEKPREEFHRRASARDGLQSHCKACARAQYLRNADYNRERQRRYNASHRAERAAANAAYREAHREELCARKRQEYAANREYRLAQMRAYRLAHREELSEMNRRWREANRDRLVKTDRRAVDPLSRNGFVYRFFDASDRLLYVGLTYNVENRLFKDPNNHASTKPWFPRGRLRLGRGV